MNAMKFRDPDSLTSFDWCVVEVARSDGPRSISRDGRLGRFLRGFFGFSNPRRLANERAEALRRFSVRAWNWDLIRAGDLRPLTDAGYSMVHVEQILAHVARFRGFAPSVQEAAA
jgi:hypothetical protein